MITTVYSNGAVRVGPHAPLPGQRQVLRVGEHDLLHELQCRVSSVFRPAQADAVIREILSAGLRRCK